MISPAGSLRPPSASATAPRWPGPTGTPPWPPSSTGSGEIAVLRIVERLAEGIPVDLRDTVTSLDTLNLALVTTAIRHAAGYR